MRSWRRYSTANWWVVLCTTSLHRATAAGPREQACGAPVVPTPPTGAGLRPSSSGPGARTLCSEVLLMRIESSVLSLSWIPSEAISGLNKLPFQAGVTHYDDPPPDVITGPDHLEALRAADAFRFANHLAAWIDVEDGRVVGHGYSGGGHMGSTTVRLGERGVT